MTAFRSTFLFKLYRIFG